MLRLFLCALLALSLNAEERWIGLRAGPFQIYSSAGDKPARETLMYLEQLRETLRILTGVQEVRTVWPIRVLVLKRVPPGAANFALGRDARMAAVSESGALPRESVKELARILLYDNTTHLPPDLENGLIELVSTLQVNGTKVTLGAPVPEAERSRGWALMHMVTVNPDYASRSHVMLSNLQQSGDFEAACHNAFEKTAKQINAEADAYLKAGSFGTIAISARALSPIRDFKPMQIDADDGRIAMADLLLAGRSPQAEADYTALHGPQAAEGLGLIALSQHKDSQAKMLFQSAIESKSRSARAWLELGKLEPDFHKAGADFEKAAALNPNWGEPYLCIAARYEDPGQKADFLKKAANLDPRNIDYWQALAKAEIAAKNFEGAQKAWGGAERAAANEEERARIHQVRLQVEKQQADFEEAERKRIAEEQERDLQRVKAESDAAIHSAEEEARKKLNPNGEAPPKPQGWWEDLQAETTAQGEFVRLDCLGKRARMVIKTADGNLVQLLVRDPAQIVITNGGEKALGCGVQRAPRKVSVQYKRTADAKLRTTGEAISIEFR